MAKNLNFTPRFHSTHFRIAGDESTFVVQIPPGKQVTGEVEFPGRRPVPFELTTPEPGGEVAVPVRLERAADPATLVIELENPRAELPETFRVQLWRAGQDEFPPDTRTVDALEGRLRVEDVFPGEYRVHVRPGEHDDSAGLFLRESFDLELHPGLVTALHPAAAGRRTARHGAR